MSEEEKEYYPKPKNMNVRVEVDSKTLKDSLKRQNQLEEELENERSEKESLELKVKLLAQKEFERKRERLGAPDNIKTISELREWQAENENSGYKPSGLDLPLSQRAKGSLKLSSASDKRDDSGFLSHEEMVEFLTDKKLTGTPQEREEAKAILDELWKKLDKGIQSGQIPRGKIFEDIECTERNESILFRALRKNNERLRKRMKEARGIKE